MSHTDKSRRDFLKTAGAAAAGAALSPVTRASAADKSKSPPVVPTRPFGKTGVKVSLLSLGGMFDIPSNQLMLAQALRHGVTYWDTADCYGGGASENGIGKYFQRDPEARKKVFLVTKSDARDPEGIQRLLDRSLERMHTDYIDLYFIHGVRRISELNNATRAWAEKAKQKGRIRLFGFSTHSNVAGCLLGAARLGWVDGIMMSYNFRNMQDSKMKEAVRACREAGIGLTAMKTQGGGPVRTESEAELRMAGRFVKQGFSEAQAKLKAVWESPDIASICSQMPNLTLLMANVAAAVDKKRLSAVDKALLEQHARETASGYCAGCRDICEGAVSGNPPIGRVMRCLMYARDYGDRDRGKRLFQAIPRSVRNRLAKLDYQAAQQRCPQGMDIARLMSEAVAELS